MDGFNTISCVGGCQSNLEIMASHLCDSESATTNASSPTKRRRSLKIITGSWTEIQKFRTGTLQSEKGFAPQKKIAGQLPRYTMSPLKVAPASMKRLSALIVFKIYLCSWQRSVNESVVLLHRPAGSSSGRLAWDHPVFKNRDCGFTLVLSICGLWTFIVASSFAESTNITSSIGLETDCFCKGTLIFWVLTTYT